MMNWLDGLGTFKWPSLLLIASPIVAYPFWAPVNDAAQHCGRVAVEGQAFEVYRAAGSEQLVLRPSTAPATSAPSIQVKEPLDFDRGGMVVAADALRQANLACVPPS